MNAKIIILYVFFVPMLVFAQECDTIIKPIKNSFFPLEVGNKYIYSIRSGYKKRNFIGYDTVTVLNKSIEEGYAVFKLSNKIVYYLKNDTVFSLNQLEFRGHDYNLLYFPSKKSSFPVLNGSCGFNFIESSFIPLYKHDKKSYMNCYKFYFPRENKVVIIAQGIGIIEIFQNGITKMLVCAELH